MSEHKSPEGRMDSSNKLSNILAYLEQVDSGLQNGSDAHVHSDAGPQKSRAVDRSRLATQQRETKSSAPESLRTPTKLGRDGAVITPSTAGSYSCRGQANQTGHEEQVTESHDSVTSGHSTARSQSRRQWVWDEWDADVVASNNTTTPHERGTEAHSGSRTSASTSRTEAAADADLISKAESMRDELRERRAAISELQVDVLAVLAYV